ncbi:GL23318 [Drosophila persimilis]|uniref:GL23318 n=1 Tax=Drosophila persimilis TaxID=7234 RepID=B4HBM1_DROPE|nr:GL23318 [Drosophila persimilis]
MPRNLAKSKLMQVPIAMLPCSIHAPSMLHGSMLGCLDAWDAVNQTVDFSVSVPKELLVGNLAPTCSALRRHAAELNDSASGSLSRKNILIATIAVAGLQSPVSSIQHPVSSHQSPSPRALWSKTPRLANP